MATKTDLRELEQRLNLRFEQLERRIDTMVTRLVTASDLAMFGERVTSGSAAGRWA